MPQMRSWRGCNLPLVPRESGLTTGVARSALTVAAVAGALALPAAAHADDFLVDSTADSGPGSLRQALADAAATADAETDTITFDGGALGTIDLTSGPLEITSPVDIQG